MAHRDFHFENRGYAVRTPAPPRKKSRLLRLLPCKRGRHASAALPTFCGKEPLLLKRCTQFAIIASAVVANFFCPRRALTGELRFCEAKWEFLKLPSNFSGESPERSAGDLPSPAKSHAAPSLFAYKSAHNAAACYQLFADKGKGFSTGGQVLRCPPPSRLPGG